MDIQVTIICITQSFAMTSKVGHVALLFYKEEKIFRILTDLWPNAIKAS